MESVHDGRLVRQHHLGPNFTVSSKKGSKYLVQRIKAPNQPNVFGCMSSYVSKSHCEIFRKDGAYWIKDLSSTNGTFLNGVKIVQDSDRELRFGDIVGIGVSHLETDSQINLEDSQYFIYEFKQVTTTDYPVVHCIDVDDEDDIEIVAEIDSSPTKACDSASSSSASSAIQNRHMRPPPPPPIISKLKKRTVGQSTSTSANNGPGTSSAHLQTPLSLHNGKTKAATDVDSVKGVSPDDFIKEPRRKRVKLVTSSSDDSSDGLGDVSSPPKKKASGKVNGGAPETYSSVSPENSSTSDDDEKQARIISRSNGGPKRKLNSHASLNSENKAKHRQRPTARKSTSKVNISEVRARKLENLKRKFAQNPCSLVLKSIIEQLKGGNYTVSQKIRKKLEPAVVQKVERQFQASLDRNKKSENRSVSRPHQSYVTIQDSDNEKIRHRRRILKPLSSSPSESETENVSSPIIQETTHEQVGQRERSISPERISDEDLPLVSDEDIIPDPLPDPVNESRKHSPSVLEKPPPARMTIKILNDAPIPRFAAKAQNKAAAYKFPAPSSPFQKSRKNDASKSPLIDIDTTERELQPMTRDEQKEARRKKLTDLEKKKKQEKEDNMSKSINNQPKQSANVKVKVTKRNRNMELMEDISGMRLDTESVVGGIRTNNATPPSHKPSNKPVLEEGEIAPDAAMVSDPRLRRQMEENISKSMKVQTPQPSTSAASVATLPKIRPMPPPPAPVPNGNRVILKPGAEVLLSPPMGIGKLLNRERALTGSSVPTKVVPHKPFKPEDDIHKRLCTWRPAWVEEHKHIKEEPPVANLDYQITMTLTTYDSFQDYFNTYYPLLLYEIWSSACSESGNSSKSNEGASSNHHFKSVTEYSVKIEHIKRPGWCPLIHTKQKSGARDRQPDDEGWACVTYHARTRNINEIDAKKNFVLLTVSGMEKSTNTKITKAMYGISLFNSEKYDVIDGQGKDCDRHLVHQNDKGSKGYRFTETVVFKFGSNFEVDTQTIGQMKRLYYVQTKIKEFRALNELQSTRLFKHIVSPPEISNPWKPPPATGTSNEHDMISVCRRLNPEQRSMVKYVTNRVFSNEPELMLMHGPPGTGKTSTLVALILQLLDTCSKKNVPVENRRILVCTPSNAAIDEIMRRLIDEKDKLPTGKKLELLRIGEGYSRSSESYSINAKVRAKDEEKANTKSLQVELTAIENEIDDTRTELAVLKNSKADPIQIAAKGSTLRDLETKKAQLQHDLNPLGKVLERRESRSISDGKRHEIIREAQIICSTLSSCSNSQMKNAFGRVMQLHQKPFLCCIVDEASQTTEPETLLPLVFNVDKLLLVGDPEQLGATVRSSVAETKGYGQSMFTRLYKFYSRKPCNPVMMLRRQYRMHNEIVKWPNHYCYGGKLQTIYLPPPSCRSSFPLRPYYFLNMSCGREHSEKGRIENVDEVEMVKALLDTLEEILLQTANAWSVGIITPYAAQKAGLTREVGKKSFRHLKSIQVDTVDGFQGQERDIIILSCVRTDGTGFLKSKNRLNVALTRAKHCLYVIGDGRNLSQDDMWRCLIQDASKRDCKYDVKPNFRMNLAVLKDELTLKLKDRMIKE